MIKVDYTKNFIIPWQIKLKFKFHLNTLGDINVISSPLHNLKDDFTLKPSLMGNLTIQNINIWIGKSTKQTSSGLHHDFHDNLYILLKGKKVIDLYPPDSVYKLYTYGEVVKVYKNGTIDYRKSTSHRSNILTEKIYNATTFLEKAYKCFEENVIFNSFTKLIRV